jgi:hypothetical protein
VIVADLREDQKENALDSMRVNPGSLSNRIDESHWYFENMMNKEPKHD